MTPFDHMTHRRADRLVEARDGLEVPRAQPEMVEHAGLAPNHVADGLDAVPRGVEDEGAVVGRAVVRARARLAVARVARGGHPLPPCVHDRGRPGEEAEVKTCGHGMLGRHLRQREVAPVDEAAALERVALEAGEGERELVERAPLGEIRDADRDVVDHRSSEASSPTPSAIRSGVS